MNDEGTYALDGDTLTFTGRAGVLSFKRVRAALPRSEFPAQDWDFGKAPAPQKGLDDYLDGLDALGAGSLAAALEAFAKATAADEENADYQLARGVTLALLERLPEAGAALERANRLRGNHEDTRLWLASVVAMNGDFPKDADIFPYATRDPYQTAVRKMSRAYGGLTYFKRKGDRAVTLRKYEEEREAARAGFPAAAAAFAARAKLTGGAGLAARIYRRGVDRIAQGKHADGLRDLEYILTMDPDAPGALAAAAMAQVCLGDAENGRLNLTRVLGMVPDHASSYLVRALAEAKLGSARRARADLELAATLDPRDPSHRPTPESLAKWKAAVEAELARIRETTPEAALETLRKAAGSSPDWAEVVRAAAAVHRAMNAVRRRADEAYAERHLQLLAAVRANPRSADAHADLAKFLYLQAKVRATWGGAPGYPRPLRYQTGGQYARERKLAHAYADQALALDARHDEALATKAWLLFGDGAKEAAYQATIAGLAVNANNPRLLKLKSVLDGQAASVLQWQADELRSPKTWSTLEYRADGLYDVTWSRPPTVAELLLAAAKQEISDEKLASASEALQRAARVQGDTAESWILRAEFHEWSGNYRAMHAALVEALKRSPENLMAHEGLARIYRKAGRDEMAFEHDLVAANLSGTTVGPLLERAWHCIQRTKYKSARELLQRAMALDPADARVWAYLAAVSRAENRADEAMTEYRMAAALEESRLGFMGRRSRDGEGMWPPVDEAALLMGLRIQWGAWLVLADRADDARRLFEANLALEGGIGRNAWNTPCPSACLPNPGGSENPPRVETALGLILWSRIGLGHALARSGRTNEAVAEFQRALAYGPQMIDGVGREALRDQENAAQQALKTLRRK